MGNLSGKVDRTSPQEKLGCAIAKNTIIMIHLAKNFNQLLQTSERSIKETGGINSDDFWKIVEQSE
ncbi:hypothetical protein [Floridanema evergladense]|uniref:Uncharacterized protein n=1 Tax=Floridaenema evergladense BLCC-F167 TaxID=3153639 RepID=A0ABV4WI54_9CYAN